MSKRIVLSVLRCRTTLILACLILAGLAALTATRVATANGGVTRLLRSPTVSATHIAFAYAINIWIVERTGGTARRVTSFQGQTLNPHFSPDGKWLAFSGEYAGNNDVYVVPTEGGEPKRLTWHPGSDVVQGWTPDGKAVMFASSRATWAPSGAPRFWTVPASGGVEAPMALPRAYQGKISPDGSRIAYRMNNSWDEERRNYRGGQNRPIWIVDLKSYDLVSPPWTDSKDVDPAWVGDSVYFISDRDGVANVWAYDTKSKRLTQVTRFTDFDVKTLDASANAVVFEQAGYIHELDPRSGTFTSPSAGIWGPKVMIVNEMAGSGGDLMPWMFKYRKIGLLVGKRTWGGLVHTADTPPFIDGGSMIAPRGGFFTRDGKWAVENEGTAPDIDVENWPKDVIAGHDPQLERAIQEAMRLMKDRPVDRATKEPPPPTWGKRRAQP